MPADQAARWAEAVGAVGDWDAVVERAAFHGLVPLLARHVETVPSRAVPGRVVARLGVDARRITRRNVALTAELLALLRQLDARGVRAIPYKGPVLAASMYDHVGLRDFSDLDLLVRRDDVPAAKAVLLRRGYRPQYDLPAAQEAAFIQTRYEHPFERPDDGIIVEVQWAFVPRYFALHLDYERLWARTEEVAIGGRTVRGLSPEDLLLALVVHGGKHLWRRLGWVCDVAELIRSRPGLDWDTVRADAERLGVRRLLDLGLRLARDVLDARLPAHVTTRVDEDAVVGTLSARTQAGWRARPETWPGTWESIRFHLRARERWRDRLRYCVGVATTTTPGDWTSVVLPSGLFPLYYPLRAVRLAAKYGGIAGRRLVSGRGPA